MQNRVFDKCGTRTIKRTPNAYPANANGELEWRSIPTDLVHPRQRPVPIEDDTDEQDKALASHRWTLNTFREQHDSMTQWPSQVITRSEA